MKTLRGLRGGLTSSVMLQNLPRQDGIERVLICWELDKICLLIYEVYQHILISQQFLNVRCPKYFMNYFTTSKK